MWGRTLRLTVLCYTAIMTVVLLSLSVVECVEQAAEVQVEEPEVVRGKVQGQVSPLHTYMRLFEQKRAMQLDAVKSIKKFSRYEQKYKLIDTMVKQLFEVIEGSKQNLTDWGYIPGDAFPDNETLRDGVAKVLESTAMFGDLILRQPDITHAIYNRHKEWEFLIGWAVWFSMESGVFQGKNQKLLNLMGQEIGLMPKDVNYVNPYRESVMHQGDEDSIMGEDLRKKAKKAQKKKAQEKKEKKKGPKLSGTQHTEL